MEAKVSEILKKHKLRITPGRQAILQIFLIEEKALSYPDIEQELPKDFDRATIYRTLDTFEHSGLLHKVLSDERGTLYALCKSGCDEVAHHHEHVHFNCQNCDKTVCLDDVASPKISLPNGYVAKEERILIQGTCASCNN